MSVSMGVQGVEGVEGVDGVEGTVICVDEPVGVVGKLSLFAVDGEGALEEISSIEETVVA